MSSPIEIERIWSRDGNIEIVASLDDERALQHPEVVLVLREHEEIIMARKVQRHDLGVSVVYSVEALALACPDGSGCWDAFLETDAPGGRTRLRMGRHRDDIADKRTVMTYPSQLVAGHAGDIVVRPHYTAANNVSIECLPAEAP